jgi:hypothetical protein
MAWDIPNYITAPPAPASPALGIDPWALSGQLIGCLGGGRSLCRRILPAALDNPRLERPAALSTLHQHEHGANGKRDRAKHGERQKDKICHDRTRRRNTATAFPTKANRESAAEIRFSETTGRGPVSGRY